MKIKLGKRIIGTLFAVIAVTSIMSGAAKISGSNTAVETVVISQGNTAPVAENIKLETFRDVDISGALKATDPEGESVTFEIISQPRYGRLSVGENGAFVYSPGNTKKGSDSFTYTAMDRGGNRSGTGTVSIKIMKQKAAMQYEDMDGSYAHYAALLLREKEIMTGECIAGNYFFRPQDTLSKGEFLSMCLEASGKEILKDVVRTGLENDDEIPIWAKQYVSTAVLSGCYSGNGRFEYMEEITYEEAAVMLDSVFSITDVISVAYISPYLRNESYQAVMNLYACGIADESLISNYDLPLTREDAAVMLSRIIKIAENR